MAEVKPGQWVNITVVSRPRAAARVKTLMRLFNQDVQNKRARERQWRARPSSEHRRGGRMWQDHPTRLPVVEIKKGATCRLFASVDVLKDLKSIGTNVEVTPG
jgi:hypothetical protein